MLFAAIVGLALGVATLLRAQRARALTLYGVLAISVGVFQLARFLEGLFPFSDATIVGRVMMGVSIVTGAILPVAALSFFLEFLNF
ncbi:MAG: histidine kinase, partial [Archangium sp.]